MTMLPNRDAMNDVTSEMINEMKSDMTNEETLTQANSSVAATPPIKKRRPRRILTILIGIGFTLLILGGGGFVTASVLEENDSFCISCHTVPEITYFNRAYQAVDYPTDPVTDLATWHYQHAAKQTAKPANDSLTIDQNSTEHSEPFRCINCHRGDSSLGHRVATVSLGARDGVIFLLGAEDNRIEKQNIREAWLPNAACVSCHTTTLLTLKGIDNHFHTHLPQAKTAFENGGKFIVPDALQAQNPTLSASVLKTIEVDLTCTSCHQAHKTIPSGANSFFMDNTLRATACVACHQVAKEGPQEVKDLQ